MTTNPAQQVADVITLPARSVGNQASGLASSSVRTFRSWTANEVDDWGRDPALVRALYETQDGFVPRELEARLELSQQDRETTIHTLHRVIDGALGDVAGVDVGVD